MQANSKKRYWDAVVYWDASDASNAGYAYRYWSARSGEETGPLDAQTADEAMAELARWLGLDLDDVQVIC